MRQLEVVYVRPNKKPEVITIDDSIEDIEGLVHGCCATIHPWGQNTVLIYNAEGRLYDMRPNRVVNGTPIFGPFIICGVYGTHLGSLTEGDKTRFLCLFAEPDTFRLIREFPDGTRAVLWEHIGLDSGIVILLSNPQWTDILQI